jgi:hypothetical protein
MPMHSPIKRVVRAGRPPITTVATPISCNCQADLGFPPRRRCQAFSPSPVSLRRSRSPLPPRRSYPTHRRLLCASATSSNHTSQLRGGLLEGQWDSPGWRPCRASLGAKTSSQEQGPNFHLVGTSQMVVICEILWVTHMACWSASSPTGCISFWIATTLVCLVYYC